MLNNRVDTDKERIWKLEEEMTRSDTEKNNQAL